MEAPLKNRGFALRFDCAKARIHTGSWTATLFCFLCELRTDSIECRFDAGLFARHDFEAALHGNVWRFDLNY